MNKYVLDTSALLAFIENEEGASEVEELFRQALDDKVEISISVISCIEAGYVSWKEQGERVARERLQLTDDLPVSQEAVDERLIEIIAGIKAT